MQYDKVYNSYELYTLYIFVEEAMQDISITEARSRLGELVDIVHYQGEGVMLVHGRKATSDMRKRR